MRKKILWIDDEIEFLRSQVSFLESRGYDVEKVNGGDRALKLIEDDPTGYDVVLLDMQMPVKSGEATLDEIKNIAPDLPVIIMTGCRHDTEAFFEDRTNGCLTKPVDPNMVLQECKRIIDSRQKTTDEIAKKYVRAYTENQAWLNAAPCVNRFISLCHNIAKWDIEIENSVSENVRQLHAGIKFDIAKSFCSYVTENYPAWLRGGAGRPMFPVDIMEKAVIPELIAGRSVFLISLSGMRHDQLVILEPELKKRFNVSRAMFLALLPTSPEYGMPSLVSGLYPDELYKSEPEIYRRKNGFCDPALMARAMRFGIENKFCDNDAVSRGGGHIRTHFADIGSNGACDRARAALDVAKDTHAYVVTYLDVMSHVIDPCQTGDPAAIPPEAPARDGVTLRTRVRNKVFGSGIFELMSAACSKSCTVILTSDHGHVFTDRPAVIYETPTIGEDLRHTFASVASADERVVFIAHDPAHFRLPPRPQNPKCLMARENNYFALAEKYGGKENERHPAFRRGGVSPEEMIMPVYVCKPKTQGQPETGNAE